MIMISGPVSAYATFDGTLVVKVSVDASPTGSPVEASYELTTSVDQYNNTPIAMI